MTKAILSVLVIGGGLLLTVLPNEVSATERVSGYTTKKGTYVPSHYRSSKDSSTWNNWSTKGNINPYSGKRGTK